MIDVNKHISEVYNEDCMIGMARYPDKYFDLALVDPPYGIGGGLNDISESFRSSRGRRLAHDTKYTKGSKLSGSGKLKNRVLNKDKCEWDSAPPIEYFEELFRVSVNMVIWGGNYFELPPCRGFAIWDKEQPWDNFSACEYAWTSFDMPSKIFRLATTRTGESKIHPTQKPVALYDWIYKNYLPQGGKVIDTHLGSGSNRIAADKAGNIDFVGFELDKDYYEAQEKRWKAFISQTRLF